MKKTYFVTLFILIIFEFTLVSCPEKDNSIPDSTLIIMNKTNDTLFHYIEFKLQRDTLFPNYNPFPDITTKELHSIYPLSKKKISAAFISGFETLNDYVLMVFIFEKSIIEENDWSIIKSNYLISKRYDLTLQVLEDNNWTINYP